MTIEEFESLVENSQPHEVFKNDWNTFYSLDFADTFLPKTNGYTAKGVYFYDGAELFDGIKKSPRKNLELSSSDKLISLINYSYPKGVQAENKKTLVQPAKHEVCTFIEVKQNDDVEVSFKFGDNFSTFLVQQKLSPSTIEDNVYSTDVNSFRKHFNKELTHDSMMRFLLEKIGVDKSKTFAYDFKAKLEKLMLANGIKRFMYSYECKQIEQSGSVIRIYGEIINSKLEIKVISQFSKNESVGEVTGLTQLDNSKHFLVVDGSNGWELYDKTIDDGYFTNFCAQNSGNPNSVNNDTAEQLLKEFVQAGFNTESKGDNDVLRTFNTIAPKVEEKLLNPFYNNTRLCVDLIQLDKSGNKIAEKKLKNHITDEPCEVSLVFTFNAKGEVQVKHKLHKDYLKEYVDKRKEEAKKRGIDVKIEELRQQVHEDFLALENEQDFYKTFIQNAKALLSDKVATYVEAIQATQKIAKNVWDEGTINKTTWHTKDFQEHKKWPEYVRFNPLVGGATDGVIDEIVGIPMAIKGVYGIATNEDQQKAIKQLFTKEGFGKLLEGMSTQVTEVANDEERLQHFTGQATVSVATMMTGVGFFSKGKLLTDGLDQATEVLKELTNPKVLEALEILRKKEKYNPKLGKAIEDFLKTIDPKVLDKLADAPGFGKVIKDMGEWWTKFHGGKFALEFASGKIKNGKVIRFEVSNLSDDIKRIYDLEIDEVLEGATKTIQYELKNWNGFFSESIKKQFTKDLQKMENLGDVQWIFNKKGVNSTMQELKENVIKSLKKADGSPIDELNIINTNQVKKLFANDEGIKFINDSNRLEFLLDKLNEDDVFDSIFEIVDVIE